MIRSLLLTACLLTLGSSPAQYCSPTFANGCFNWRNLAVTLGTINWTAGSDCYVSDFTALSTAVTPGVPEPMTVTSGNWTGCAVWIDLNDDLAFSADENLYHAYVGGDPGYTYSFNLTVPESAPAGSHRVRVIAGWGSDGFTEGSANGFGPCGTFQYGNFNDFTVVVTGSSGMAAAHALPLKVAPNPATDRLDVRLPDGSRAVRAHLVAADGRSVRQLLSTPSDGRLAIDLTGVARGAYLLQVETDRGVHTARVTKD